MATNTGILDLVKPAGNENALISVINSNMDKVDAEAGRQRGNIAANYSTSSAYDVGDLCIYQGNLYRCNTAIASGEEWTAAHWTQVNIAGELDSQKQDITSNTQAIANNTIYSREVTIGDITLNSSGYQNISSSRPTDVNIQFAIVSTWGTASPAAAFSVNASGTYVIGSANQTITQLKVKYYYKIV